LFSVIADLKLFTIIGYGENLKEMQSMTLSEAKALDMPASRTANATKNMSSSVTTLIAIPVMALGLSACAGAGADYRPVVDMSGHSQEAYSRDVAACQQTARTARNNTDIAEDAGMGAAGGGAVGAVAGAIGGSPLLGAGVGALAGLAGTGGYEEASTENREERIVKNCMRARGYTILG
jgi:outer membrane lipoprotein SlyB